jgi:hypothetical protein
MSDLKNWHWTRWLRAVVAGAFIAQGIAGGDGMAYAIGAFFGIQAILNVGCWGTGGCVSTTPDMDDSGKEINYQEIR